MEKFLKFLAEIITSPNTWKTVAAAGGSYALAKMVDKNYAMQYANGNQKFTALPQQSYYPILQPLPQQAVCYPAQQPLPQQAVYYPPMNQG